MLNILKTMKDSVEYNIHLFLSFLPPISKSLYCFHKKIDAVGIQNQKEGGGDMISCVCVCCRTESRLDHDPLM